MGDGMTNEKVEIMLAWRRRIQANLDAFAQAVENQDVEVGLHCLADMTMLSEQAGQELCRAVFGFQETVEALIKVIGEGIKLSGGSTDVGTESHSRWTEAIRRCGFDFQAEEQEAMDAGWIDRPVRG